MLEFKDKNYSIEKIKDLKDFITVTFVIIDDIYQEVTPTHIKERRNIDKAILTDSEIITISIVGELLTVNSEKSWFGFVQKNLDDLFPNTCSRSRFNRTRRNLQAIIEEIRKKIVQLLACNQTGYRIVDSVPIPVCKFGRAHFNKTFTEHAEYGYCASKKETYFGFKLHVLITLDGSITDFTLTDASIDDRKAIWDLVSSHDFLTILGDKGYIDKKLKSDLKQEKNINLIPLQRSNSKTPYPKSFKKLISKIRRKIETTFSQLTDQLNLNKVLAKSLWGLMTRIKTKLLAHNLSYFINKCLGKTINIGQIKELVFG